MKDIIDEKIVNVRFNFSTYIKHKVKIKEIIEKHNRDLGWKMNSYDDRDELGDKLVRFELTSSEETLKAMEDNKQMAVGLIEDIFISIAGSIDEETAEKYSYANISLARGSDINDEDFFLKSLDGSKSYFIRELLFDHFEYIVDVNKVLEAERKYPELIRRLYGTTLADWYNENIDKLSRRFIGKEDFEKSKAIVNFLEKNSKIEKIPYNEKKFRIHLE